MERDTILLVDDERDFVVGLSRLLQSEFDHVEVLTAGSGGEAIQQLQQHDVHLMITDYRMPVMDGLQLMSHVLPLYPDLQIIVLTGFGTIEKAVEAVQQGAFDFLTKPVASEQLFRVVKKSLDFIHLVRENKVLKDLLMHSSTDDILGQSAAARNLKKSIDTVASSDYPVLVLGESGTGKELVSRRIHSRSQRSGKSFVTVNCPAIPDSLLESELFGHCKGAFTGADKEKQGLFLTADGGTLHLDEIGDISSAMQIKILRFLQEGEVRPLGSSATHTADVRIIASTNQDLEHKVESGLFRADLYYRLNVIAINIPTLKERVDDIPLLARFFLEKTCSEMKTREKEMRAEVLTYLMGREWPGNVRELQNYVRRLVVFSGKHDVTLDTVHLVELQGEDPLRLENGCLESYKVMKAEVTDRFSKQYIEQLLQTTRGNVSEAARISGLSRVAIQKLTKRLNVDVDSYRG